MVKQSFRSFTRWVLSAGWTLGTGLAIAQPNPTATTSLSLADLSAFKAPTANWRIVGGVRADLKKDNTLVTEKGTGVLVTLPEKQQTGHQYNLLTTLQHGDLDLELDYMMARNANSGIYLQGRYEVQLFDSWGIKAPRIIDNGSIYERWDEKRPEGQNGYEGHPARQNASRAPGLWQHLKISFQAPRFNANGQKTENARMLRVELNGVTIHENVELSGPTRASMANDEVALGPLTFQGDHGSAAFRNIRYVIYDKPRPELVDLKYAVYKGSFQKADPADFGGIAPESEGLSPILTASVSRLPNDFLIRYTGTLRVKQPGDYTFNLGAQGGRGTLKINNQTVVTPSSRSANGKATLPAGDMPFELTYTKFVEWAQPALGLAMAGPGVREFTISATEAGGGGDVDPIIVDAQTNTILRSFMDIPGINTNAVNSSRVNGQPAFRVVHAVSVGSPDQVHYTYDLDRGALVQVWRGAFLDTTPMWHERGDGSSRPMGMVQRMGMPMLFLTKLSSTEANWPTDTTGSNYRPKGYVLDENDRPSFRYLSYGATVEDKIRVLDNSQGIRRDVTIQNPAGGMYARIASGTSINPLETGMYVVDGQAYVRVDDGGGASPIVRPTSNGQELIIPIKSGKLSYSILF